jgi:hypothetical protein
LTEINAGPALREDKPGIGPIQKNSLGLERERQRTWRRRGEAPPLISEIKLDR